MSEQVTAVITEICQACGNDRTRMMDIVRAVQEKFGGVSGEALELIASLVGTHRVEVESVVSFYAFLSKRPSGKVVIRLCDDIIDRLSGGERVAEAMTDELGISFGETTSDGKISLERAACIGMCDQAPAALVNDTVVTNLSGDTAREMIKELRTHLDPKKLTMRMGDGNNAHDLVRSMVENNLRLRGEVVFWSIKPGEALGKAVAMSPVEVIRDVKTARLRGRGGAGFPTGMKWEFTRGADGDQKYVICNADEGEPGTFKDRVILTECAHHVFEGMTIGGYAVGSDTGIVYLRAEYAYLRAFLENVLAERREKGFLGKNVCGKDGFNFDIRIQMGAGAYVCGEETGLIGSCEGLPGNPKTRPPFPAQEGYLGCPTTVNNVETFCCVSRILDKGPGWFAGIGSPGSTGTKVLSVSGDCNRPGVYEVPFGITLEEVLKLADAEDAAAVQVGGASGRMVGPKEFAGMICYDKLATGGSIMVFNSSRNVLEITEAFMDFFVDESCGFCTACRVGNKLLYDRLRKIIDGQGEPEDLDYLQELGQTIKTTSRCGLGQTSANPVLTTLANFREVYEAAFKDTCEAGFVPTFDIHAALGDAEAIAGRQSVHFTG